MKLYIPVCIILLGLGTPTLKAQLSPYYEFQYLYDDALELFEKGKYGAARKKADSFLEKEKNLRNSVYNDLHVNARYIQAVSAYHLERNDVEALLEKFVFDFGENTKADLARYYLGKYYYERRNYVEAIGPLLDAYQGGALEQERFDEVVFMLGYSYFKDNRFRDATRFFQMASRREGKYQEDALYYQSVILYQEREYEAAIEAFQELKSSRKYGSEIRVYLANSLLKLKRYDELFVLADELVRTRISGDEAQIFYIVANASFERKDYPKTVEYFERYQKSRGKMNKTDYFRYGYSRYKLNQFEEAIPIFERALGRADSLEQIASYYLGFCFLKKNPKDEASAKFAFQRAAESNAVNNPVITEDALYQSAKVSYATEDYQEALQSLLRLTKEFPQSPYLNDARSMIGEAYLYTKDYPKSIQYFQTYPPTTVRARKAYQTVCYFYALEQYERPNYNRAIRYFDKSIEIGTDPDMKLSAMYWEAEAKFRQGNLAGAKADFRSFLETPRSNSNEYYTDAYYGLGWVYFKEKNYSAATSNFDDFLSKSGNRINKDMGVDALLRAGDSQFLLKRYQTANNYYNRVLNVRHTFRDYALYQLGESYYRQNDYRNSVQQFDNLIRAFTDSELRDNALDRISDIYATWIKDNAQASKYAQILVKDYPQSPLAAAAYNRLALAAYYSGNERKAIQYFKTVINDYAQDSKNAQVALDNLSALLPEDEFDRVLADYRNKNPDTNNNLADLVFNTGQDRFFAGNYSSAIEKFTSYIQDYKNGPNYYEALLFRARSYKELGQLSQALGDYKAIYSTVARNDFTNVALLEAAEIRFAQQDYNSSLALYEELDATAGKLQNRVQAKFGIAKNQKALRRYKAAINTLRTISDNAEVAVYSRTRALVEIGHNQYLDGDFQTAFRTFGDVEREFKNAFGAESQYMITRIIYEEGKIVQAQAERQKNAGNMSQANQLNDQARLKFEEATDAAIYMNNNYPTFNEWKARAFLVAANAYYELGNVYQAKGTLRSLVDEDRFPDVQAEARKKLEEIEAQEAAKENNGGVIEDLGGRN